MSRKYKITIQPQARQDIKDIWKFSAKKWNPTQADKYTNALRDEIENIATGLSEGRRKEGIEDYYFLQVGKHYIIYEKAISNRLTINIVRILWVGMDLKKHLN